MPIRSTMHLPPATGHLLKTVAHLNRMPITTLVHVLAKREAHERGLSTTPPDWEIEASRSDGRTAILIKHTFIDEFILALDEASQIAQGMRRAAQIGASSALDFTTDEDRRLVITSRGKGVEINVDDAVCRLSRLTAFDLAESIDNAVKEFGA